MAKGKAQVNYVGQESQITSMDAPDYDFIYESSTVKNPNWNVGDRVMLPDGRVFRYAKSGGAILGGMGAPFSGTLLFDGSTAAAAAVGDKSIQITGDAGLETAYGSALTKDCLRGGIFTTGFAGATLQQRGIIGNTAGGNGDTITLYLDAALDLAVAAGTYTEMMDSPYAHLGGTAGEYVSFAGIPAVNVTAANVYFWVQTWGIHWVTPGGGTTPGDSGHDRQVAFVGDGSINGVAHITVEDGYQIAGFIVQRDSNGAGGPPWIMLQVSP